jgi:hypothetical protein
LQANWPLLPNEELQTGLRGEHNGSVPKTLTAGQTEIVQFLDNRSLECGVPDPHYKNLVG